MSNTEQVIRLLREVERLSDDREDESVDHRHAITPAALLQTLVENDFDLTTAIVSLRDGA